MSTSALHLTGVATVVVPVADQDRALGFYAGVLGFEATIDFTYETGERWLEVSPPDGPTRLTLTAAAAGEPVGTETGVILASSDVPADHAALLARGADVDPQQLTPGEVVRWAGEPLAGRPAQFRLRDPDGNGLLVVSDH